MRIFKRLKLIFLPAVFLMLISSCSSSDIENYTHTVSNVDLNRFMGKWYVQAGRFTMFEKDPYNSIEKYTWLENEKKIKIDFSYNQGSFNGPIKKIPQTGWIKDTVNNSHWKISPMWPFKFDYLIIALADNYEWTVIGVPSQKWFWVMSKKPQFSKEKTNEIISMIKKSGYDVSHFQYVSHQAQE